MWGKEKSFQKEETFYEKLCVWRTIWEDSSWFSRALSKSGNGNMYILAVVDYFSKYTEIYPLPNMEAETIADAVFRGWIKRYGCPYEIHIDQGSQFESQLFSQLCEILCISKTRSTVFHPRSDGMLEILNRTIKEMISKYVNLP